MRLLHRRAACLVVVISCLLSIAPNRGHAQSLDQPEVVAQHAIVVDASTGDILLDKASGTPVAMASLTKLFTAFVAIESTPLDLRMTVHDSDLVGEASMGLSAGENLSFQTLLHGMLLPSGNDAAAAIARNLGAQAGDTDAQATQRFVDRTNARLGTLGINSTHLVNPHGLDANGHYSTARDIAAITLYALDHEPTFSATIHTPEYEAEGHLITNTNRLLGTYDGLIGGKTGVTDNAGYCLMQVAERDGRRIITVLLGSTPEAWYDDAEALLDFGFAATAVPGAATRYGQISFATTPTISVPVAQDVTGLSVSAVGPDAALVSEAAISGTPRRSPWLWIITALVIAPASMLILAQLQRGLRRRTRRTAAYRPIRPAPRVVEQDVPSQADALVQATAATDTWWNVAPDYRFDETTDWQLPTSHPNRPRTREDRRPRPAFMPSFSGD